MSVYNECQRFRDSKDPWSPHFLLIFIATGSSLPIHTKNLGLKVFCKGIWHPRAFIEASRIVQWDGYMTQGLQGKSGQSYPLYQASDLQNEKSWYSARTKRSASSINMISFWLNAHHDTLLAWIITMVHGTILPKWAPCRFYIWHWVSSQKSRHWLNHWVKVHPEGP